ncbi:MAG: hypothetical protein U0840_25350 [Gemmataceae bacterium]
MLPPEQFHTPEPDQERQRRLIPWLLGLLSLLFLAVLGITAFQLRDQYNPFWERTQEFKEVQFLAVTLHKRVLTEDEFSRALELCEVGHVRARADAVSVVEESVKRDAKRIEAAVVVLKRVAQTKFALPKKEANRVLGKIAPPPHRE